MLTLCCACDSGDLRQVDLTHRTPISEQRGPVTEKPVRIAIGAMITPEVGYGYYRELLDYIGEQIGRPVELVDRNSYGELNELLGSGQVDIAFVCGGPYVEAHARFGVELIAAPQAHGSTTYYSYIIVPADSTTTSMEELRGKSFAFTDPSSNSGALYPRNVLARLGETPESFFGELVYTYAHDKSIQAVAQGLLDGAAVDHLIWKYMERHSPEVVARTRVIQKSPAFGTPPIVARAGLDQTIKKSVQTALLRLHETEQGKAILTRMMIDRFVLIDDSEYDTIRSMRFAHDIHEQSPGAAAQ